MLFHTGEGAVYRANPLTKLALVAAVAAMLPLWPAWVLLLGFAACLGAAFALGFGGKVLGRILILMVPTAVALVVVQGMLIPRGPISQLGPFPIYPAGLAFALLVLSRLLLLLAICLLFIMTTRPGDLARALDAAGLAPSLSYLLTAPLSLIDAIAEESRQVRDSLRLRGFDAKGGLRARIRLLMAMLTPLVRNLITEAPARAELLELRGFRARPRRSSLTPLIEAPAEPWLRRIFLLLALLQLGMLAL